MSWDLAVWEGEEPTSDEAAGEAYGELMAVYEDQTRFHEDVPPTPALAAFLDALAEQLPDDPEIEAPRNPWAFMPLRAGAKGPIVLLHVRWDYVGEVLEVVPLLARDHGLICFDLQEDTSL